jgi:exodeoxyribonuclease-3
MDIATFNVNSVKARLHAVTAWLDTAKPDIACLQEIKTVDADFPHAPFEERGYNVITHGQKSYNGVAILSKIPFEEHRSGLDPLPGSDEIDDQARYIEAVVMGRRGPVRVASIYLPNGNPTEGDGGLSAKYLYKLDWMERLRLRAKELLAYEEPLILAGDYNVIPTEDDVYDPIAWEGDAAFRPETHARYNAIKWLGLTSAYEQKDGRPHEYTFWDYQAGAWRRNNGIRIDHLLCSASAADKLTAVRIDKHIRALEKPSDHVPFIGSFDL